MAQDVKKFYWMRYAADRATNVVVKNVQYSFTKGSSFGVREVKGKPYDLIMIPDGSTFRLPISKSEILMNRSKEYKGVVRLISPPSVKERKPPVVKHPNDAKYKKLVAKFGKFSIRSLKAAAATLKDSASRLDFKRWALTQAKRGTELYSQISNMLVNQTKVEPKIIKPKKKNAIVTKLTPVKRGNSPVRIKLSELELPSEDDFTDYELPEEFRHFAVVESSHENLLSIACQMSVSKSDILPGVHEEFQSILHNHLTPAISRAKEAINKAVKETAAKVRVWALEHLQMAKKLHRRTDLFEKIINDPEAAVRRIADRLLAEKPA